jgi:hypothetical protein
MSKVEGRGSRVEGRKQAPELSGPRRRGPKDIPMTAAGIVGHLAHDLRRKNCLFRPIRSFQVKRHILTAWEARRLISSGGECPSELRRDENRLSPR